jgi:hypothetical protein
MRDPNLYTTALYRYDTPVSSPLSCICGKTEVLALPGFTGIVQCVKCRKYSHCDCLLVRNNDYMFGGFECVNVSD